jgi:hypothetical protein
MTPRGFWTGRLHKDDDDSTGGLHLGAFYFMIAVGFLRGLAACCPYLSVVVSSHLVRFLVLAVGVFFVRGLCTSSISGFFPLAIESLQEFFLLTGSCLCTY